LTDKNTREQLGVVFTPIECIDFIVHSVVEIGKREFNNKNLAYTDPFGGTGIFTARIIQLGYIDEDPLNIYQHKLVTKEYNIFNWYIMTMNIEQVFHEHTKGVYGYQPYLGAQLTDTFQEYENERIAKMEVKQF
jgi:predicted helicase